MIFSYLGFLSRPFKDDRTVGEGERLFIQLHDSGYALFRYQERNLLSIPKLHYMVYKFLCFDP